MNVISRRLICILLGLPLINPGGAPAQSLAEAQRDSAMISWASDGSWAALAPKVARFFGDAEGRYVDLRADDALDVRQRALVVTQFQRIFDGVPSPELVFPDGFRLLASAQPHNVSQVAIAVTNGRSNELVAAGLLHNFCGKYNQASRGSPEAAATGCENEPTLTIF